MRKFGLNGLFLGLFVFVFLILSVSVLVHAEEGTGSGEGSSEGSGDSSSDANTTEVVAVSEDVSEDVEVETTMETPPVPVMEDVKLPTATVPTINCDISTDAQKRLSELNAQLVASAEGDAAKIKIKIEALKKELAAKRELCLEERVLKEKELKMALLKNARNDNEKEHPVAVAVGKTCEISDDLRSSLKALKEKYTAAIEIKDFNAAKTIREDAAKLEQQAMQERNTCLQQTIPGILKNNVSKCEIPKELYDKFERDKNRISELEAKGLEIPEDLKKDIDDLESRIAERKAKCNALNFTHDVKAKDVKEYYMQRIHEVLSNNNTNDSDTKIQDLRELRREIDESIKNLIEEKRKLNFNEVNGLVDEVKFRRGHTSIGDSNTTENVSVDVDVDGSSVNIQSTDDEVLLIQDDVNFTAEDITVNESGIFVGGVLVKNLPKEVFLKNKDLGRKAKKLVEMKLEKEKDKAVYKAKYEAKRKLLGVIGVKAKTDVTVDAETGETISEKKPWWTGLSTEVKEDVTVESETEVAAS